MPIRPHRALRPFLVLLNKVAIIGGTRLVCSLRKCDVHGVVFNRGCIIFSLPSASSVFSLDSVVFVFPFSLSHVLCCLLFVKAAEFLVGSGDWMDGRYMCFVGYDLVSASSPSILLPQPHPSWRRFAVPCLIVDLMSRGACCNVF
eukprot:RCo003232